MITMKKFASFFVVGFFISISLISACSSPKKTAASKPVESAKSNAGITNTYWKLSTMNGKKVETPDNAKEVHIKFTLQENRLQGYAGCNGLGGSYELTGANGIKIRAITTKMYCDRMDVENYLTNAITKANTYKIDGEKLL